MCIRDRCGASFHPDEAAVLDWRDFAMPRNDAKELQADGGVRVAELTGQPWPRTINDDSQLFVELAHQRFAQALTRLDLAAGKFPVCLLYTSRCV